jgi:hypothetical protein
MLQLDDDSCMHIRRHSRQYYDAYEGSEQAQQQQQRGRGSGVGWQQAVVLKQLGRAESSSTWQQQWRQGGAAADDRWEME